MEKKDFTQDFEKSMFYVGVVSVFAKHLNNFSNRLVDTEIDSKKFNEDEFSKKVEQLFDELFDEVNDETYIKNA